MKIIEIDGQEYKLDLEQACTLGIITPIKPLPKSWKEYITQTDGMNYVLDNFNTEDINAFLALGQLIQLRDAWRGDWKPSPTSTNKQYAIIVYNDNFTVVPYQQLTNALLSFNAKEIAWEFIDTFKDILERAKKFI